MIEKMPAKSAVGMLLIFASPVFAEDLVQTQFQATPNKVYEQNQPTLTVANYNIAGGLRHHQLNLDEVAQAIKALNPDIIALEEVDQNTLRSGGVDQAKVLAEKTGMYYSYGKAIDIQKGYYGNAILSKFPIEKTRIFTLPSGSYEQRTLMLSKLTVPGFDAPVYVYNTHFDWHEEDDVRMSQARFINSIVFDDFDLDEEFPNLATGITLLMGDFNSVETDRVIVELKKYWNLVKVDGTDTRTWPAGNPGLDLDHIFTGRGQRWKVEELIIPNGTDKWANVHWPTVSDHIPVAAKLALLEQ